MASGTSRQFVITFALLSVLTLVPVVVINLVWLQQINTGFEKVLQASDWQQQTHGVTSASTVPNISRPFKVLRLNARLPDINTVIFGSSTAQGITADAFPEQIRAYNFAQNGHPLRLAIPEMEYLLDHAPQVKWMVIPLDWSMGFIMHSGDMQPDTLTIEQLKSEENYRKGPGAWIDMLRDAVSYPRINKLFHLVKDVFTSADGKKVIEQAFAPASAEYPCENTVARDYEPDYRGKCAGFHFDGSNHFNHLQRVSDPEEMSLRALNPDSLYAQALVLTKAEVNMEWLERLAALDRRLAARGGRAYFYMPPMLPGLETAFLNHPAHGDMLAKIKNTVSTWAAKNSLVYLDAGQSESFGCASEEFVDPHHATPDCYRKIFRAFLATYPPVTH